MLDDNTLVSIINIIKSKDNSIKFIVRKFLICTEFFYGHIIFSSIIGMYKIKTDELSNIYCVNDTSLKKMFKCK